MAILFGTTSDGESLPVQVNASGQLVAVGMEGPQGPEGPEGPAGPQGPPGDGNLNPEVGIWTPVITNQDGGTAIIDYSLQRGYYYKFGGMLTYWWQIAMNSIVITNARGPIEITGFPYRLVMQPNNVVQQGLYSIGDWGGFKYLNPSLPQILMAGSAGSGGQGDRFRFYNRTVPTKIPYKYTDLDEEHPERNSFGGSFMGLSADEFAWKGNQLIRIA